MTKLNLPPELSQYAPRSTKPSASFLFGFFMNVFLVVFALILNYRMYSELQSMETFKNGGVKKYGIVTQWHREITHGKHAHDYCYVDYRYAPLGADFLGSIQKTIYVRTGMAWTYTCNQLTVGQKIPIVYDPNQHNVSMLLDERIPDTALDGPDHLGKRTYIVMDIYIVICGLFAVLQVVWYQRKRFLLRTGHIAAATFIDTKILGKDRVKITYEFNDVAGRKIRNNHQSMTNSLFAEIKDNPLVIYDLRSSKNILYPPDGIRCC